MANDAPTADDLLAHTDWLHALARALAGDANADDVVQETYEVALTKPPKESGPLRPWLGGVARNVARMATRGRVRREQHEQAVPAAIDVPTPEQLVERVQMQQQVARIVLELAEPLRATLLLRFFEGMTAAEIARAQGIPAATVRGRIKDALERVRATLDTQHSGDRKRWFVLLAPLATRTDAAAAVVAGGLIVNTGMKLLLGIVVLVAVLFGTRSLGWWGGSNAATQSQTTGSNAPVQALPAVVIAKPGPTRATAMLEVIHDDDPKGALRLEGQVIDEKDAAVGGARVAIDANPPIVVETDASGNFVFEGLIPRDYRLEASGGDGYAGPARLRLTAKSEPVTLRMRRAGSVDVTVTAVVGGKPIASADVELRSTLTWTGKTDASGTVKLRGVGAVWAPLVVRATGFAPAAMMLSTSGDPAAPSKVSLALSGGAAISGRVVDDAGKPIEGVRVVAISASEPFPVVDPRRDGVTTSAEGRFMLPTIAAGTWRLSATHGEFAPATSSPITVDGTSARDGVEIKLASGGVVRGIVRDKSGQPVAAADVRIVVRGHLDWRARRQAYSGADGGFAIAGLPRRAMDVVAAHDAGASAIVPVDLAAKREHDVALTLDVLGAIIGTVVDKSATPIGDAQVIAEPEWTGGTEDRTAWSVRGIQQTVTDQGGAFRFAGLPDGNYRVRAARPGAPEAALSLAPATVAKPGASLRIVVPNDGRIIGKVALADGKVPARFAITLGAHAIPFASSDGTFAIVAPGGTHDLVVTGPSFVEKHAPATVTEGKDVDVGTITVVAGRAISGRVLDSAGAPVAKAKVAAGKQITGGGNALYIPDESPGAKDTETDENGRFSLDGFTPTSLTVVAGKDDVGRSASVLIPAGPDSATVDLVLQRTTGLEGKIMRSGVPVGDVVVIAHSNGANFFVTTGADGSFALDALAPGTYTVFPMFGGGGPKPKDIYMRRVEVVAGKRARVEIDAVQGTLTLTVNIKGGGAMVLAVQAAIEPTSLDELRDGSALPVADDVIPLYIRGALTGTVDITGMRPGLHTVCAVTFTDGAKPKCAKITLEAAQPKRTLELVLPK